MYTIIEISLYPLTRSYTAPILEFIACLKRHDQLDISVSDTSTTVRGNYDHVMPIIQSEMKKVLEAENRAVFVMKVLNAEG